MHWTVPQMVLRRHGTAILMTPSRLFPTFSSRDEGFLS